MRALGVKRDTNNQAGKSTQQVAHVTIPELEESPTWNQRNANRKVRKSVVEAYNISLAYNIALPYNISLAYKYSLVWMPDDTRLLSGSRSDPTIRAWGTSTWKQVRNPCTGHTGYLRPRCERYWRSRRLCISES